MAWFVAQSLLATRLIPTQGKDWNDQLLSDRQSNRIETSLDIASWQRVAQALGKSEAYIQRVAAVTEELQHGQPLSAQAKTAMLTDFTALRQTQNTLWQWHEAARMIGKKEAYLHRITEVAIAFNAAKDPSPVSKKALAVMRQDVRLYQQPQSRHKQQQQGRDQGMEI